jgi:hypothetical protein
LIPSGGSGTPQPPRCSPDAPRIYTDQPPLRIDLLLDSFGAADYGS